MPSLIDVSRTDTTVMLEGYDAGVSFRTVHDPAQRVTYSALSNTSSGAWPIAGFLDKELGC